MSQKGWPGLGYDPAPGNPQSAADLAHTLDRTAKYLKDTYDILKDVENKKDVWTGKAAQAFADRVGELPKYLNHAQESLTKASGYLQGWQHRLAGYQKHARDLEQQAEKARHAVGNAEDAEEQARRDPRLDIAAFYPTQEQADAAQQRYDAARRQVDDAVSATRTAHAHLDDILRKAEQLQNKHDDDGDATAGKISAADDGLAPPEPGIFERIGNAIMDNLKTIGDIAGMVSAVAGALAFIPVLAPVCAPLAVAAGGVALAAHSANMAVTGKFSAVTLGADVLGIVPGIGAVKAGMKGVEAAEQAGASLRSVSGIVATGKSAAKQMGREASEQAAGLFHKAGGVMGARMGVNADHAGKIAESAFNVGSQVPTAVGWATGPNTVVGATQDVAGVAGAASSANAAADTDTARSVVGTVGRLSRALR